MVRIRITIDTTEAAKRTFAARAAQEGLSPEELFEKLLLAYCPENYAAVVRILEAQETVKKAVEPRSRKAS